MASIINQNYSELQFMSQSDQKIAKKRIIYMNFESLLALIVSSISGITSSLIESK